MENNNKLTFKQVVAIIITIVSTIVGACAIVYYGTQILFKVIDKVFDLGKRLIIKISGKSEEIEATNETTEETDKATEEPEKDRFSKYMNPPENDNESK
jgi:hypothetical protein